MKVPLSNILLIGGAALVAGVVVVSMTTNNANSQTPFSAAWDAAPAAAKTRSGVPPIDAAQPAHYATATFAVG